MAMNPARCYHPRRIRGQKHDLARTMSAARAMLLLPNELSSPADSHAIMNVACERRAVGLCKCKRSAPGTRGSMRRRRPRS